MNKPLYNDQDERQIFADYLEWASKLVSTWPEWKQEILGFKPEQYYPTKLNEILNSIEVGISDIIWGPELEFIPIQPNNQIEGWDGWSLNAYPQELTNEQKSS